MKQFVLISFLTLVVGESNKQGSLHSYDVSDLESYNCYSGVESGSCVPECGLNECYRTTSVSGTTFPEDGFCAVFNISQGLYFEQDWYSVSGQICLSSPNYPQGTGLLFNYQNENDYEVIYKTSQTSSTCYLGYVQSGVVQQTGSFDCGITTANQWHRYTVIVYCNKTYEASLSTQAGSSTTSGRFPTNYPMSTRGGTLMVNDGSASKSLDFDGITVALSTNIDECASSPCGPGGSCEDGCFSYTCNCYLGYTGVRCETALPPVIYFLEWSTTGGYINSLTPDGVQTRVTPSGGSYEAGLVIDFKANLLFYTTSGGDSEAAWRAELYDVDGTRARIWNGTDNTIGITLSTADRVIFVDQYTSGIVMLGYGGILIDALTVVKSATYGLAVDEPGRTLYFTDYNSAKLWKVNFTPASFTGTATTILEVGQVGNYPAGLVLEGDTLYWILRYTGEIRSMPVTGSTSTVVVPAATTTGYESVYLTKKSDYFYYTRFLSDGGVYRVAAGGTREKITTSTTLQTLGIDAY